MTGTPTLAPQAQFVDANSGQVLLEGEHLNADLVSATVTLTHHGSSQLALTLNNQRHDARRHPVHPPWKYNSLAALKFGQRLRIEFRYGSDGWKPLMIARITDIDFSFESGRAQLTVRGEDLLSLLKTKSTASKRYRNEHENDIVRDVVTRSRSGLNVRVPSGHEFSETLGSVTHQEKVSYLQFIESLAERLDYELFMEFDDRSNRNSGVSLHFEPARSLRLGTVVDARWGQAPKDAAGSPGFPVVDFKPKFKVWEQFASATSRGRNPRRRRRIAESVQQGVIDDELHTARGGARPINAIEARRRFFGQGGDPETNDETVDVANLDEDRARAKARAVLRRRAREFLTADLTTMGHPELRPGIHVNMQGLYAPFDGIYYVTQAVHTLDGGGYKTRCALRRPGMLDPNDYPPRARNVSS